MRIRLDRTMCDGFGQCAKHAPEYFSLDDWGYASLEGNGSIPEDDQAAVMRALLDCPVHAIIEMGQPHPSNDRAVHAETQDVPEPDPRTEGSEAISEFAR